MGSSARRADHRSMLALIALAEGLPAPQRIDFHPNGKILSLTFEHLAGGIAWSAYLGGRTDTREHDGRRWLDEGVIDWHGWSMQLHASSPVQDEPASKPLPRDVTERLSALALPASAAV